MKKYFIISGTIFLSVLLFSCNENNTDENNDINERVSYIKPKPENSDLKKHDAIKLLEIPLKTQEETSRKKIDSDLIAVDVFKASIPMNKCMEILQKMFPEAKITNANASESFDAFNIETKDQKKFCGISIYDQNDKEEFVIKTIYIGNGFFNEPVLQKIF